MKSYVLDSYAILAYSRGEKGAWEVSDLLSKALSAEIKLFQCVINWGEVYYITLRVQGKEKAELLKDTIARYPITIIEANEELTLQAAYFKAFNKISYADAFAAALTKIKKAILVTGDPEFKSLESEIKIQWI